MRCRSTVSPVAMEAAQGGGTGGEGGGAGGRDRGESGDAGVDVGPGVHDCLQGRGGAGGDRALEHRRLEAVDHGGDELPHRRMRRPAYFWPARRRPVTSSAIRKPRATSPNGGTTTESTAVSSARPSA